MNSAMDLQDVEAFKAGLLPVILRSTSSYGDIVSLSIVSLGSTSIPQKPGSLDLLLRTMPSGTKSFSKEEIDRILTETGASFSPQARMDYVEINVKTLKRFLPKVLPVVSEMIQTPLLEVKEVKVAKDQLTTDLKNEGDHPDSQLQLLSHKSFYREHPYFNRPSGYLDTVANLKADDLKALLPKIFNVDNTFMVIIGDLTQEEARRLISEYFGTLPRGERAPSVNAEVRNKTKGIDFHKMDAPTTYFLARFKAPSLTDEDYPAMAIAMQLLDNRLFDEVRTKRALTYAVSANLSISKFNSGSIYVTSTQMKDAVKTIHAEIKKLQTKLISQKDLELEIRKFVSNWYLGREQSSNQARILAMYESIGYGWEMSSNFIHRLNQVTPQKVKEVMNKYMKDFTVTVIGPQRPEIPAF